MLLASPPLLPAGEPILSTPSSPEGEEVLKSLLSYSSKGSGHSSLSMSTNLPLHISGAKSPSVQVGGAELPSARVQVGAVYWFNHHCLHLLGNPLYVLYPKSFYDSLFLFILHRYMNCNDTLPSGGESGGATTSSVPSSLLHCSVDPVPEDYLVLF